MKSGRLLRYNKIRELLSRVRRSMILRHGNSFKGGRMMVMILRGVRLLGEGSRMCSVKGEYSYSYRKGVVDQRRNERRLGR